MKKNSYMLTGFDILLFLCACKKEKNEESIWYINGVKYSSRNTTKRTTFDTPGNSYKTRLRSTIQRNDSYSDGISLIFKGTNLPQTGTFTIKTLIDTDRDGLIILDYNHYSYYSSIYHNGSITASSYNGLAKYEIAPVWFKSNNGDSILFSGTFYEPIKEQ